MDSKAVNGPINFPDDIRDKLASIGQSHITDLWPGLNDRQRDNLRAQILDLDFASLERMRVMLDAACSRGGAAEPQSETIMPAPVCMPDAEERAVAHAKGVEALSAGHVGVLLVAGGQGSRLGFEGPKGCFPIGPVSKVMLFDIHARKLLALERRYGAPVPFYIMTSEANDEDTRSCFAENGYFGLDPARVVFFVQGMWPALDPSGRMVLERPDRLFMSPDGHGGTLAALERHGVLDDMRRRGLKTIFYFQVDNPLVDIADPVFVGLHLGQGAEMSLKVCSKRERNEGLGVVVQRADGRMGIVEYSELSDAQRNERDSSGQLRLRYGSVAIHLFDLKFLVRAASVPMPLHLAHKRVPYCDAQGQTRSPAAPNAYKFEKFIFDILPDARHVVNLVFDRRDEFSPVKNASGADSPLSCKRDISDKFARWIEAAGLCVPRDDNGYPLHAVEIDPCFALGPQDLIGRLDATLDAGRDIWLRAEDGSLTRPCPTGISRLL